MRAITTDPGKKYPQHGLPAVRLARLAVSRKHQGKGYGGLLLAEAIHRTVLIAEQAGLIGLCVDAKDERAHKFHERYGFVSLPGHTQQLFLPLETLRLAGEKIVLSSGSIHVTQFPAMRINYINQVH